ncbi:MAG: HAMP domain-containing histidine kinase [Lachnospiraceae bacterium]|nr:HAMP domain-containing histidine kinase [Lachnospiraceae bacterium]
MKFFWKIFFSFTALLTIIFSIFGIWAISQSFNSAFQQEIEEGNRENRMFQYAFEMNVGTLPVSYQRDEILLQMVKEILTNLNQNEYTYTIFDEKGHTVFSSNEVGESMLANELLDALSEEDNCAYEIVTSGEQYVLYFMCRSQVGGEVYYLETAKDITGVYQDREDFYGAYRAIMFTLIGLTAVIIFITSHMLTKSIVTLSETTKKFAEGNYDSRAKVIGEDEIALLSEDFNNMADSLEEKMVELTDAVRRQEDFTASFAHELKTPLTSIIGYSDMLRRMEMNQEETAEAANYIYTQGKRLESLSFKLLELIVVGKQEIVKRNLDTLSLGEELDHIIRPVIKKEKIQFHCDLQEGYILGEHDLILSLFLNLIDNARKALAQSGAIWIEGHQDGDYYHVEVKDNGCGMPEDEIHKITEAFYMVDKSRARKQGGAGLGMTLCNKIVEIHQGRWEIKSSLGEGTTISVWLPAGEEELEDELEI